jgi:formylglycine-generating enzyme required for sulfatase activity
VTYWRTIFALAVLTLAGYWVYQQLALATLVINSDPDNATVFLDGRAVGITPFETTLSAGRHLLELEHSYFERSRETLDVRAGEAITRRVILGIGEGTLDLLSNPKGAWVEVDGRRLGSVTPAELRLTAGEHRIRMGLPERRPVEQIVVLDSGSRQEVTLTLDMDPHGSLTVTTRPTDARVSLPDLGVAYQPGVRIPIGEHLIEVSRPGYTTSRIRFEVRYGENETEVVLPREYGQLIASANRADAEISVAFTDMQGRPVRQPYSPGMRLPVGPVDVRARSLGQRSAYRKVDLTRDGATVRLVLKPMEVKAGAILRDQLKSGGGAPEMIVIPAGEFVMGDDQGLADERPQHTVVLTEPFAMSVREVSSAQYRAFAAATGRELHVKTRNDADEVPARYISWRDASAYTDWLTDQTGSRYRLPSEAEWEYVARAGTRSAYFFGDSLEEICVYANLADQSSREFYGGWESEDCDDGYPRLAPVGRLKPNPFGVHDILGNVTEWVLDCGTSDYATAPSDGSAASSRRSCRSHGYRGGSWDSQADQLRSAYRSASHGAGDDRGIRLVREL